MSDPTDTHGRFALRVLASVKSVHVLTFALVMPLGPQFARVLDLSTIQHGILSAAYPLAAGLCGLVALFFTETFAGRKSLLIVCAGYAASLFACALAGNFQELLLGRITSGVLGGLLCAWLPILVTRSAQPGLRSPALRRALAWQPAMTIAFALPVMIFVATHYGWHAGFVLLGVIMAGILPFVARLPALDQPAFERLASERQLRVLSRHARNRIALVVGGLLAASSAVMVTFFSGILVLNAGFTEADLPVFFITGGSLTVLLMPLSERLTKGREPFVVFGVISLIAASIYFLIAGLKPSVGFTGTVLVATLFMWMNNARFSPASALINLHLKPRYISRYFGLSAVTQQAACGIGFLIAGFCIQHPAGGRLEGVAIAAMIASLLLFVAVLFASALQRHPRDRRNAIPLVHEAPAD
ncbi:MFS transporter [Rariglobus hedericola]|uniref:MFS transporter n=1 Tax=Rariglobus hedericola TaxID=2597822 RepID=A0A556QNL6_9BACT|nr:MFS transporter [Rariglobus hedericola]TSJ78236.1 MFS transporter [Rariglobus hedericola]